MSRTVALDSNILLLYITGFESPAYIDQIKRLKAYSADDYTVLKRLLRDVNRIVLTPNTVSETSNLLRIGPANHARLAATRSLRLVLDTFGEVYVESAQAFARPESEKLGITDAVLLSVAETGARLITADLQLYLAALQARLAAENFNYYRDVQG